MDLPPPPNPNQGADSSFNSIFGSKPPVSGPSDDVITQVNNLGRRIRMIEESILNVRRKVEIEQDDNLKVNKKQGNDIQTLYSEMDELKHIIRSFKDDMVKIIQELQNTSKKEEVVAIQKYVDLWRPINFVTQKEVESIVNYVVDQKLSNKEMVSSLIENKMDANIIQNMPAHSQPEIATIEELAPQIEELNEAPQSILHAMAQHIEKEKFAQKLAAPNQPKDLQETTAEQKSQVEVKKYEQKIDAVAQRKKQLHDLLGK